MNSKTLSGSLSAIALLCGIAIAVPSVEAKPKPGTSAQSTTSATITPGQGIGLIKMGQSLADVQKTLGQPKARRTFEQEKALFDAVGRNTSVERLFIQQFDVALEYGGDRNRTSYPIFKVYLKNDRVIQINLSWFLYKDAIAQTARLNRSNLGLLSNRAMMERVMGKDYFSYNDELDFETYEYLQKGVSFVFDEGKVVTILLYKPLTEAEQETFIRKRSPLPQT